MSWGLGLWYVRGYCCSVTNSYLTLCNPMDCRGQVSLSSITSRSLLKIMSIEPTRPSDHLILCRPRLYLPSAFPSIGIFYNESALRIRWLKSIGTSASASVLPMNIQGWFPLGLTGLISLLSKGLSRVFSSTTIWRHQLIGDQPSLWSNSHICAWLLEKS